MAARTGAPARPRSGDVIVATKLHIPALRQGLVQRDALVASLAADRDRRLVLVAAPPGAGKTTVLAEWAASPHENRSFAWLSLDAGDNDPVRFWSLVHEALGTVDPGVGAGAGAALRAAGTSLTATVLPLLVNDLVARDTRAVLVLDDYHVIREHEIHDSLAFLIERAPRGLQVAVASRSDPPLPLPRLRARGELTELRAATLRFSDDEAEALLNDGLGLDLGHDEIAQLQRRTEGWAAGLQLAGLSLRGRPDPAAFIAAFAGDDRQITDYLGSEVLDAQQPDVRDFLLRTAVLDRLCSSLCDALTGELDGAERLAALDRENLFVVPLDASRRWYRYHHLFGELLRHRLTLERPDDVPGLHRRAAAWYADCDAADDAIRHALAAGDVDDACDLVARHWSATFNRGHLMTVARWLDALPAGTVQDDDRLWLARAWVTMDSGRLEEIDVWLAVPGTDDDERAAWTALLRGLHAFKAGDVGAARRARAQAPEVDGDAFWSTVAALVDGVVRFWSGERTSAAAAFETAARLSWDDGNNLGCTYALGHLALIDIELGDAAGAERRLEEIDTMRAAEPQLDEHFAALHAHVAAGRLLERRGDLPAAVAELDHAVELARRGAGRIEVGFALTERMRIEPEPALVSAAQAAVGACPDPCRLADLLAAARPRATARRDAPRPADALSVRELGVLRLLPSQLSMREIGAELYVSLNTVKSHVRSIYLKLGAGSRDEAVMLAREQGLL